MKKRSGLIIILSLLLLVGCGSNSKESSDTVVTSDKNNNEQIQENNKETSNEYKKITNDILGFEITYPSNIFTYNDNSSETKDVSFMSEINKSEQTSNIFLSISTSEYNIKDTEEGLKLQAFSENIKVEDVVIGNGSISARKIKVSEENNQGRIVYYYVFEREDDKNTYIIEIDTISNDKGTEKYIKKKKKMLDSFKFTKKEISKENKEEVKNAEMGFSFYVSKNFFSKLISSGTNKSYDEGFKSNLYKQTYYVDISGIEQEMFTIYKIDGKFTEEEVKSINPNMIYLESNKNSTFTIIYEDSPNNSLSDKGSSEFSNLMDNEVSSVAESFTISNN